MIFKNWSSDLKPFHCYVNKVQIIMNLRQTTPLDTLFSMKGSIATSNSSFQQFREKKLLHILVVWNPC